MVVLCRNTTEAINHLAYRLRLAPDDVVVTTVVEHHANLLPWARVAQRRWVECGTDGTFTVDDVIAVLDAGPRPKLLAMTGASNVTGWLPPVEEICAEAHARGVPGPARRGAARPPPSPPRGARLHRLQRSQALRALRRRRADRATRRVRVRGSLPRRWRRRGPGRSGRGDLDRTTRARGGRLAQRDRRHRLRRRHG